MPDTAIKVENLSKRYRIGLREKRHDTFGAAVLHLATSPIRNLGRLRRLSRFSPDGKEPEDVIWALRDVSFEVKEGEIVGIIGRNGAGKTTLLKILSRITTPTRGRAVVHGRVSSLLEVGTGFHPELTGRENVYLNGTVLGMRRQEVDRKFDEIVDFSGVEKFVDTPVKRFSSGMQMRLAFAVAAHLDPEILLVDEVLAVGDAEFQKKCLGRMENVAQEGRTVLFVSHNISAVNRLCPRAVLLEQGQLTRDGRAQEVTTEYLGGEGDVGGSRTWSIDAAPGSDEMKLTSVSLLNSKGASNPVLDVQDELHLRIEYYVGQPNLSFRCSAQIFTQGILAFVSIEPTEMVRGNVGNYYSTVTIPAHLLAEGEYTIGAWIFTSKGVKNHYYVAAPDLLRFLVFDSMPGTSARGDYTNVLRGIVMPRLKWDSGYGDTQ